MYSPVILFTYNRSKELAQTLDTLSKNKDAEHTDVYIFSNAPDRAKRKDEERVLAVRSLLREYESCFHTYTVIYREENKGVNENMLFGIREVLKKYDRAIILEDDIITAPCFLTFMNQALEKYEACEEIFSVCGYNPANKKGGGCVPAGDSFAYEGFRSWGWATWKNRFERFYFDKKLIKGMDVSRVCTLAPLYSGAFLDDVTYQKNVYNRFLDYQLFCYQMANRMRVIYSKDSLCDNIGWQGDGCTIQKRWANKYINKNFDPTYSKENFELSATVLNSSNFPQYFYEFRSKEFSIELLLDQFVSRESQYCMLYYAIVRLQMLGIKVEDIFSDIGIRRIAIYGYGIAGELLLELLKNSNIEVLYIIDKNSSKLSADRPIYPTVQNDIKIDAVIVTALRDFFSIEEQLASKTLTRIFSFEHLICEALKKIHYRENCRHG